MMDKEEMKNILLTSTGLSNDNTKRYLTNLLKSVSAKSCAIITTAAKDKENNKYSKLAEAQLKELGLTNVFFFDFDVDDANTLTNVDAIYVCGGNTFKLLQSAKSSNFSKILSEHLGANKIFIGVSAGSCILGKDIKFIEDIGMDENEVNLEDTDAYGIIDGIIVPHYEEIYENILSKVNFNIYRMTNSNAFVANTFGEIEEI